jgi:tetratricopeptide (TPR) repeat protein
MKYRKQFKILLIALISLSTILIADFIINYSLLKTSKIKNNNTISKVTADPKDSKSTTNSNTDPKPSINDVQKELEAEYQKGYDLYNNGQFDKSISAMDSIISKDDSFYKAYTIKGIAQCRSNNYNDGIKNLDKALSIKPDYGYGRYNKAFALELYQHYDDAIKEYLQALDIEPYVWSYYGISSIYGRRGDVTNSVKYLNMAINEAPKENMKSEDIKACARAEKDFDNVKSSKEFIDLVK